MVIEIAKIEDLEEILTLQKKSYQSEAALYDDYSIPPLTQTLEGIKEDYAKMVILKAVENGKIIGSVRAFEEDGVCNIGRLIVHPTHQNKGIGKMLMNAIEDSFRDCMKFSLFTGNKSLKNISFYTKLGYRLVKEEQINENLSYVFLDKCK